MDMAAKGDLGRSRGERARRLVRSGNIDETLRRAGVGMDEEGSRPRFADAYGREGQAGEKRQLRGTKPVRRPFDGDAGGFVHVVVVAIDGGEIVIARDADRALRRIRGDAIDNRAGIGAIADEISEIDEFLRAQAQGLGAAGLIGFEIGVNIGEESEEHGDPNRQFLTARKVPP